MLEIYGCPSDNCISIFWWSGGIFDCPGRRDNQNFGRCLQPYSSYILLLALSFFHHCSAVWSQELKTNNRVKWKVKEEKDHATATRNKSSCRLQFYSQPLGLEKGKIYSISTTTKVKNKTKPKTRRNCIDIMKKVDVLISAPQSKNAVSINKHNSRYFHWTSNFSSIRFHTKRL